MDYGKRKYGTSKKTYIEYASEITDQYIKSIGGVHKADFKRPYKADDYHSMMYSFDTPMKYLGGTLPTLESLNLAAPVATVETPAKYFSKWTERQPKGDVDSSWSCCCADYDGSVFIVGENTGEIFISRNAGRTWDSSGGYAYTPWTRVACDNDGSFTMMVSNTLGPDNYGYLYTSADSWGTWRISQSAGPYSGIACDSDGSNLISCNAVIGPGYIHTSSDYGMNWTTRYPVGGAYGRYWSSVSSSADGSFLVATCRRTDSPGEPAYGGRIYTSSDGGANWTERRPDGNVDYAWGSSACSADGSFIVVGAGAFWPYTLRSRLYTSSDYGATWTERRPAGDANRSWGGISVDAAGKKILVTDYFDVVKGYYSTDSGATWIEQYPSAVASIPLAISGDGLSRIAVKSSGRIYTYV